MADQVFSANAGFFDAVNHDRTYTADQMNMPYKRLISDGIYPNEDGTNTDLQAQAGTGMQIIVKAGNALAGGKWFEVPSDIAITVPNNVTVYPRIDSVILCLDDRTSARAGTIIYRTGEASPTATAPDLDDDTGVTEFRLANIAVASGASAIIEANITDLRGTESAPWITSPVFIATNISDSEIAAVIASV